LPESSVAKFEKIESVMSSVMAFERNFVCPLRPHWSISQQRTDFSECANDVVVRLCVCRHFRD